MNLSWIALANEPAVSGIQFIRQRKQRQRKRDFLFSENSSKGFYY